MPSIVTQNISTAVSQVVRPSINVTQTALAGQAIESQNQIKEKIKSSGDRFTASPREDRGRSIQNDKTDATYTPQTLKQKRKSQTPEQEEQNSNLDVTV